MGRPWVEVRSVTGPRSSEPEAGLTGCYDFCWLPAQANVTAFGAILATCLTPAEAAARLGGITQVRVRQMIREGALYAVRIENRWRIPVFQLDRDGLVRTWAW